MAGLHPDQTFAYEHPEDASLPPEQRRRLTYRYNSAAGWMRFAEAYKAAMAKDGEELYAAIGRLAATGLVGWENVTDALTGDPIAFSPEAIGEFGTIEDLIELCRLLPTRAEISDIERKKPRWQSRTDAASSALTADQATASATAGSSTAPPAQAAAATSATTPANGN